MPIPRPFRTAATICFWAYGLFLVAMTHAPSEKVTFLIRAIDYGLLEPDKLIHMAAYSVLALLAALACADRWGPTKTAAGRLFGLLALWGMADEATQPLFRRVADANDWIADLAGVAVGLAIGFALCRWLAARQRSAG